VIPLDGEAVTGGGSVLAPSSSRGARADP
jgi:hypothetical protein